MLLEFETFIFALIVARFEFIAFVFKLVKLGLSPVPILDSPEVMPLEFSAPNRFIPVFMPVKSCPMPDNPLLILSDGKFEFRFS